MSKVNSYKLVLLGESAVGKSSLVLRFVRDEFSDFRESTIGAAFLTQTVKLDEERSVKFEIWDTAGQERYRSLAPIYFRNSAAAVVVYDITQSPEASFEKAKSWVQTLKRQADATTIIILVGNKLDLATSPTSTASEETSAPSASSSKRRVPKEMAERYAEEEGLMFMEASAKTGEGVEELFMEVARKLPLIAPTPASSKANGVKLASGAGAKAQQACSC